MKTIRWGIIGAGAIAEKVAVAIKEYPQSELTAIASRDLHKAEDFARRVAAQKAFGSYEELCSSADIDIIYIATPHAFHKEHALLALNHGKHVMCEKPFCLNWQEANEVVQLAKRQGLFLMEAMWTRTMPGMAVIKRLVDEGKIGRVTFIEADFGFQAPCCPKSRLFNPQLGGGALLDVGIYPLTLAISLLGQPEEVSAKAMIGQTGVDEISVYALKFEDGALGNLKASISQQTDCTAKIYGTEGSITLPRDWWHMNKVTVNNDREEEIDTSYTCSEYYFEIEEACRCVQNDLTESPLVSHSWTLDMMSVMDRLRASMGLSYPQDSIK